MYACVAETPRVAEYATPSLPPSLPPSLAHASVPAWVIMHQVRPCASGARAPLGIGLNAPCMGCAMLCGVVLALIGSQGGGSVMSLMVAIFGGSIKTLAGS